MRRPGSGRLEDRLSVALECPGVHAVFAEGQTAEIGLGGFTIANRDTSAVLQAHPVPPMLLDLMQGGGLYPHLERQGLIGPAGG